MRSSRRASWRAATRSTRSTIAATVERLGAPQLRTVRLYDGLFHEIYNEPERDRVLADLESWFDAQR